MSKILRTCPSCKKEGMRFVSTALIGNKNMPDGIGSRHECEYCGHGVANFVSMQEINSMQEEYRKEYQLRTGAHQ
jgi:hypothetical protein